MAYADDFDGCFVPVLEEEAVIAATEAEAGLRRLELFHIAVASGEIAVGAVKDFEGCRAVDAGFI